MRAATSAWITTFVLFTGVLTPHARAGQKDDGVKGEHHRYKVIDLGSPLGGPGGSYVTNPWTYVTNPKGAFIAVASTPSPDPYSPNHCLEADCFVNHAVEWRDGIVTDLGALPGINGSLAFWINASGLTVGVSENSVVDPLTGYPEPNAVVWKKGKIINLGTLGGNASYANSINGRGQVVGGALNTIPEPFPASFFPGNFFFFPVATEARAFLWENGVMRDLGTLGGPDSIALFVNDYGQVVGDSSISAIPDPSTGIPPVNPFLWVPSDRDDLEGTRRENGPELAHEKNGKMLDLGSLGGTYGYPNWLSNRGQVVGQSNLKGDNDAHPFLWDGKLMNDLGTLGGKYGAAYSVNDADEVVGIADLAGDQVGHAFLWKDGVMTDLGTPEGSQCSLALSINSTGQIVGESQVTCGPNNPGPGWLWENGGPAVNLNALLLPGSETVNVDAVFINDRGEIAGEGVLPNGDVHAVLLVPCDRNHPDFEGCDYESVVTGTIAPMGPAAGTRMAPGSDRRPSNSWIRRGGMHRR